MVNRTAPSLFVIQGRDQGTRYDLDLEEGALTLGRDAANTIQLHDTEASRRHAEIRRAGEAFKVTDLNSSNGTFVNGRRVQDSEIRSGDQLQIGRTFLLFTIPGEHSQDDLGEQVNIVQRPAGSEESRIVRSVTQEEGSSLLSSGADEASHSPWLARARSNLQIMYRTALAVSHTLDIDQLLDRIMQLIFEWVEADRGCVMLVDQESKALLPKVRRDRKSNQADEKITISKTILDFVMERREGVLTSDAREDHRWNAAASIVQMGVREAICVPMQGRYDVVGVIYIDTSIPAHRVMQLGAGAKKFTEEHLKLMVAIGHQAALAVEDTAYYSAMLQSERLAAVGQTIATLSHHIKNILQGIRGGSYLIELGLSGHDENVLKRGWDIVEKNQNRISALVMDMLSFSKEREPEMVAAELNTTVGDVIELMQTRANEVAVELRWTPCAELPTLCFDPEGIHRAVLNIVSNAIDACDPRNAREEEDEVEENEPKRGKVAVSSHYFADQKLAQIIVEDNGCGIPPEELQKIFTVFVSSKGSRGTGLGLPVSQKIFKEHGGRIQVSSTVGQGSRFTLELPALAPDPVRETHSGQELAP
ncbi:MAG TPA: ATP-binding protein [Pirellulales bacterium]|jgi:signal transduction histidine kinase|nr:ATP-binding protein [Pirellulales bacterium]